MRQVPDSRILARTTVLAQLFCGVKDMAPTEMETQENQKSLSHAASVLIGARFLDGSISKRKSETKRTLGEDLSSTQFGSVRIGHGLTLATCLYSGVTPDFFVTAHAFGFGLKDFKLIGLYTIRHALCDQSVKRELYKHFDRDWSVFINTIHHWSKA